MKLRNEVVVAAPLEETWRTLLDVARVARALPGASIEADAVEGVYRGTMRVKLGPVTTEYTGAATLEDADEDERVATFRVQGREAHGHGTATATITNRLVPEEAGGTRVIVETELDITGKAAQFGRGILEDVSSRLLDQFASRLEAEVLGGDAGAPAARKRRFSTSGAQRGARCSAGTAGSLSWEPRCLGSRSRRGRARSSSSSSAGEACSVRVRRADGARGGARPPRPPRRGREGARGRSEPRAAPELQACATGAPRRREQGRRARGAAPPRRRAADRRAHPRGGARALTRGQPALAAPARGGAALRPPADPLARHRRRLRRPCRSGLRAARRPHGSGRALPPSLGSRRANARCGGALPRISLDGARAGRAPGRDRGSTPAAAHRNGHRRACARRTETSRSAGPRPC